MNQRPILNAIVCAGVLLLLFLAACSSHIQDVIISDVPITVYEPGTQNVDIQTTLETVTLNVRERLPESYFTSMIFSGRCQDLPHLRGKLVLVFVQVQRAIPRRRIFSATASVDTIGQTMDIRVIDVSDSYPSTQEREYCGNRCFKEIVELAYEHVTELGLSDCDVTLTQLDDSWDVRCGPLNDFTQECRFEISNGEIHDKPL